VRFRWSEVVCGQGQGRTADLPLFRSFHPPRSTAALLVIAGFLIVWLCLDACGFRPLLARGRHGAGSRPSGARRSLRCVNQCSLSGPRLRTGEPLTSPLPWCCPHWDDSSSAVSLPLPLVGAMKGPLPMTSVEPGRATLPGCGVPRAGAGKILPRPRRTVGGEEAGHGASAPAWRFCGCWSPSCSPSSACWPLVLLRVVADAWPREAGAGRADAGGARRARSPKRERAALAPPQRRAVPGATGVPVG
jgi:hypothetical protein